MIICSPELGLSPESNLGGEVHDREMIKALDGLGIETLIILPLWKKHPVLKHAKVYFLPIPFVYPPWLFNFLILPHLFILYRKYHFDILRVHAPYFVGFGALLFKLFHQRVKVVATYHHVDRKPGLIDRFLLNKFDVVTTVSQATRNELGNGVVIPNGVDGKYKPLPKNKELMEKFHLKDKKVLLYLGQLIARKNIPFLFKIIKKLSENYVLMICGDGPLRQELENKAPDNVIFTGRIPEEDKVDYYNLANVFVYPSLKEGFGLSVLEALKCGDLVIANNLQVFREYQANGNLYLVEINVAKWVKFIVRPPIKKNIRYKINYDWKNSAKLWLQAIK